MVCFEDYHCDEDFFCNRLIHECTPCIHCTDYHRYNHTSNYKCVYKVSSGCGDCLPGYKKSYNDLLTCIVDTRIPTTTPSQRSHIDTTQGSSDMSVYTPWLIGVSVFLIVVLLLIIILYLLRRKFPTIIRMDSQPKGPPPPYCNASYITETETLPVSTPYNQAVTPSAPDNDDNCKDSVGPAAKQMIQDETSIPHSGDRVYASHQQAKLINPPNYVRLPPSSYSNLDSLYNNEIQPTSVPSGVEAINYTQQQIQEEQLPMLTNTNGHQHHDEDSNNNSSLRTSGPIAEGAAEGGSPRGPSMHDGNIGAVTIILNHNVKVQNSSLFNQI